MLEGDPFLNKNDLVYFEINFLPYSGSIIHSGDNLTDCEALW